MNYKVFLYHDDKGLYNKNRDEIQKWLNVFQPSFYITNSQEFMHDFITEYVWSIMDRDDEDTRRERLRKIVRNYTYLQYEGGKTVEYKEGMGIDEDSSLGE
jgi:hypothetical protein